MKKRILALTLACVMLVLALPALALPAMAAEGDAYTDTYVQAEELTLDNVLASKFNDIPTLLAWKSPNGTPADTSDDFFLDKESHILVNSQADATLATSKGKKEELLIWNAYAVINPRVIEMGILDGTETSWETVVEKYSDFLEDAAKIEYKGNWQIGGYGRDGEYHATTRQIIFQKQSVYALRKSSAGAVYAVWSGDNIFASYEEEYAAHQEDYIARMLFAKYPTDASGNFSISGTLKYADVADIYSLGGGNRLSGASTPGPETPLSVLYAHKGAGKVVGANLWVRTNGDRGGVGYFYTVPDGVFGEASLSFAATEWNSSEQNDQWFCITVNGEAVWPEGADALTHATWQSITATTKLSDLLASVKLEVSAGDQIGFVFERNTGAATINMQPTVSIERKCSVVFKNAAGETIATHVVEKGGAMPKAPFAAGEGGFKINGVAAASLPETVEESLTVEYVGDPAITETTVEKVAISVGTDFAIHVYLRADAYALRAGLTDVRGNEYWGEAQEDGTFKVTMPGFVAKELCDARKLFLYQEFNGGTYHDTAEAYSLVPADVLAAYATSDVSAADKAVAAAALDYAKAAKAYFAGEALEEDVKARLAAQDEAIAAWSSDVKAADKKDLCINGMTLVLKDQVTFKVRVASSLYAALEEEVLDLVVSVEGSGTENTYTGFVYTEGDEGYSVTMTLGGISAIDFAASYRITVKDEAGFQMSDTLEYSVNDYIARTFDASAAEADLLRAIFALGEAAADSVNG